MNLLYLFSQPLSGLGEFGLVPEPQIRRFFHEWLNKSKTKRNCQGLVWTQAMPLRCDSIRGFSLQNVFKFINKMENIFVKKKNLKRCGQPHPSNA